MYRFKSNLLVGLLVVRTFKFLPEFLFRPPSGATFPPGGRNWLRLYWAFFDNLKMDFRQKRKSILHVKPPNSHSIYHVLYSCVNIPPREKGDSPFCTEKREHSWRVSQLAPGLAKCYHKGAKIRDESKHPCVYPRS